MLRLYTMKKAWTHSSTIVFVAQICFAILFSNQVFATPVDFTYRSTSDAQMYILFGEGRSSSDINSQGWRSISGSFSLHVTEGADYGSAGRDYNYEFEAQFSDFFVPFGNDFETAVEPTDLTLLAAGVIPDFDCPDEGSSCSGLNETSGAFLTPLMTEGRVTFGSAYGDFNSPLRFVNREGVSSALFLGFNFYSVDKLLGVSQFYISGSTELTREPVHAPEPSTFLLTCLAAVALAAKRERSRRPCTIQTRVMPRVLPRSTACI